MYFNGIYSVSHLKLDLMWLKIDFMWLFSNHISMLNTDGSHITVYSFESPTDGLTSSQDDYRAFFESQPFNQSTFYGACNIKKI